MVSSVMWQLWANAIDASFRRKWGWPRYEMRRGLLDEEVDEEVGSSCLRRELLDEEVDRKEWAQNIRRLMAANRKYADKKNP